MDDKKIVIHLITTEDHFNSMIASAIEEKLSHLIPSQSLDEEDEELLTIKQLAAFFQVSETSIHTWKNEGILPYVKVKSRIRFKKSEVLKLYEKRKKSHR